MVYKITRFDNVLNPSCGVQQSYDSLAHLYTQFQKCPLAATEQDKKNSAGWVRGLLKNNYRKKENIDTTQFIIIDVDKSNGKPYCIERHDKVHQIMTEFNINHILHTTWSNREDGKYRYRLIVPTCREMYEEEVEKNSRDIVNALNGAGCDILYASENKAMSQMWFYPSSPAPEKWFKSYIYDKGIDYEPKTKERYSNVASEDTVIESESLTIRPDVVCSTVEEMMQMIQSHQDIHGNLLNLTYQWVVDGVPDKWIRLLGNYLLGPESDDRRIEQRRIDLGRMIEGARNRVVHEQSQHDISWRFKNYKYDEPPMPPGRLGQMVAMAHRQQSYQNKTIALVSCLGMVSGVAGYKFQCPSRPSMGCNDYFLLSMKTGGGKDFASRFIISGLAKASVDNTYRQFIGNKSVTSGKALRNMLERKRSCVCVITEMGQVLASTSGDPVSTRRAMLEVYSKSGPEDIVAEEGYSKDEDSIKELAHPALTIVGEGEPDGFIRALKNSNSTTDGFAPRCLIFRADQELRPYENEEVDLEWDSDIIDHISHMIKECSDMTMPHFMKWESRDLEIDVKNHSNAWTDHYNKYDGIDNLKAVLSTRMHVHAIKMATVCAVMNRRELIVKREDWEWAKEIVMFCFNQAESFMDSSSAGEGDGTIEDTMEIVVAALGKYFRGEYKGGDYSSDKYCEGRNNILPVRVFRKMFYKKPAVKKMSKHQKSGYDVLVTYLTSKRYVMEHKYNGKDYYVISETILELI